MQSTIHHTAPVQSIVKVSKGGRYVQRIPALIDERRQDSQQWDNIHFHEKRGHGAQGTRRAHTNERKTHPNWSPRRPGAIPHTTNPTMRTMATTLAIKKSQTSIRAGKQCIWPTINRTGSEMDARSMRVPSQVNMAKGNKSRKLCGMANPCLTQRQQVLSGYRQNIKRAYESDV
jgi:hypothetical protein